MVIVSVNKGGDGGCVGGVGVDVGEGVEKLFMLFCEARFLEGKGGVIVMWGELLILHCGGRWSKGKGGMIMICGVGDGIGATEAEGDIVGILEWVGGWMGWDRHWMELLICVLEDPGVVVECGSGEKV